MAILIDALCAFFFALFGYLTITARTRRQVLALALAALLAVLVVNPPSAQAQVSLLTAIQSVLNVINGTTQTALSAINSVRRNIQQFYEQTVWPASRISQEQALMTQMIGQYRNRMQGIFEMNIKSASLPDPIALETVMRNHQTSDLASLTASFSSTFGAVPSLSAASPADRTMMDMDDALAMDSLKAVKGSDAAGDLTLQAAASIEDHASRAAPGSASFITATATATSIESQALIQKMLAAELRQEAARLAHQNALRKRGAAATVDVYGQILRLLKRR